MPSSTVLILGGTGFLGRAVCEKLVELAANDASVPVRRILVTTRRTAHGTSVQSLPMVEVVQANPHDDAVLEGLIGQAHTVINLIAQLHGTDAAFQRAHMDLPRRIGQACARAGGRRVIHVSALGLDAPNLPSRYLRSKAAGEQALRQTEAIALTVLRPSVMFGASDASTRLFASLQRLAPLLPLAGGQAKLQPVWVDDVATAVVRCLTMPSTIGETFDCAGPQVMTLAQLARDSGRMAGCKRPVLSLPNVLGRLQATAMEWLPGEPMLTRDNLDSLSLPNVSDGKRPGLGALGIQAASFETIGPTYLADDQGPGRLNAWRAHARRR
jgi:uncharacterized protein YbjT (DUF2867 family)